MNEKVKVKREHSIPNKKIKTVEELKDLLKKNNTFLIASIKDLPGSQYQEVVKKIRTNAVVKVPKRNLILRAIEESGVKGLKEIEDKIGGSVALVFSNDDSFDLAAQLLESKSPAKAKAGQIAPEDVTVEPGPTELMPGPAISELGAVGLQVQIEGGKIAIKTQKVIVKKGEAISTKVADVMSKLDIKPFSIGFIPLSSFDIKAGKLYAEINIDKAGTLNALKEAHGRALPFAVEMGYTSPSTITYLLGKGHMHGKALEKFKGKATKAKEEVKEEISEKVEEKKEDNTPEENKSEGEDK